VYIEKGTAYSKCQNNLSNFIVTWARSHFVSDGPDNPCLSDVVLLDALRDLTQSGGYTWGAIALVHMYDNLNDASKSMAR